jgi:imidazolonepropionase
MRCDYPNARKLIDEGARVALATDFNPGTSPSPSVDLAGLLARLQMNMSLPEVICAYTVGAAFALKLENQCGSIESNMSADFLITSEKWTDLFYEIGPKSCREVYYKGRRLNLTH